MDEWMGGGDPVEPKDDGSGGGGVEPTFEWPLDRDVEFSHVVTKEEREHLAEKMHERDPVSFPYPEYVKMSDQAVAWIDDCIMGFRDKQARENHAQAIGLQRQKLIDGMVGAWARRKAKESEDVTPASLGREKKRINIYLKRRFGSRNEMSAEKQKELYDFLKAQGL